MLRYITVSGEDEIYECFPDLLLTRAGKLLCVYRESESHTGYHYSRLVVREGFDFGRRWSEKRTVVTGPKTDDKQDPSYRRWNCPRLSQLSDGRVALTCDFSNEWIGDLREKSRIYIWWSHDEGKTWSGAQATGIYGIVPDRICELRNGILLIGTHLSGSAYSQFVWRSEDAGRTWKGPTLVASHPNYKLCEGSIIQLPDNTLVCYMRENSRRGDPGFKSISTDSGRTWKGSYATLMEGCHRPVAGILSSGRILITYRCQVGSLIGHENLFAYIEDINSALERDRSKQTGRILPLDHDNNPRPDTGYSGWVQFPNGEILAVYYIKGEAEKAYIKGVFFNETDFCLSWTPSKQPVEWPP